MNPGLALFKALVPGGVEVGRRVGRQRLLNGSGGSSHCGLEPGPPDKNDKRSPAQVGARRSHLLLVFVCCHGYHWGVAAWEGPWSGGSGGTSGVGPGLSQTRNRQVLAAGSTGPPLPSCSSHTGGSFLAQGFLMCMRLSPWSPPNLEFTFEGVQRVHKVVQASPLCSQNFILTPKGEP